MHVLSAASAVTRYAGPMDEMISRFAVIAAAVAVIVIALVIYSRKKK